MKSFSSFKYVGYDIKYLKEHAGKLNAQINSANFKFCQYENNGSLKHMCVFVCMCAWVYICVSVYVWVYMFIYTYVCVCLCMCKL